MRNKKFKIILGVLILSTLICVWLTIYKHPKSDAEVIKEITPIMGSIQTIISTTGTVYPKNRLEIKPPVNGRVETVLVKEGEKVVVGQTLAWVSSTERAVLLDAAYGQGQEKLEYWQQAYKPIALLSPINAEIIVSTTQPGQNVTTSDAIVVLSDELIVRGQVDETDIGKIKLNQRAGIILDAYPDTKIEARVGHIYYESETVNNVTIYKVDLIPLETPGFFRSGMNATVDFIVESRDKCLLLPVEAVHKEGNERYVLLRHPGKRELFKQPVGLGITDDKNYEVLSGVTPNDTIIITTKRYLFPSNNKKTTNPFMPRMPGMRSKNK